MSDLEAVLERLLGDPSFAASLAADPAAALAGYHLTADDMEILSAQVSTGTGGERSVETRTSQASMFGLLAPLAGAAGLGAARSGFGPAEVGRTGFGQADTGGLRAERPGPGSGSGSGSGCRVRPAAGAERRVRRAGRGRRHRATHRVRPGRKR